MSDAVEKVKCRDDYTNFDFNAVIDTARKYHAAGLHVIPIAPAWSEGGAAGKRPLLPGWQTRRAQSPAQLEQLFRHPCNIGIVTGASSGILCLDIDPKNGGFDWYNEHRDGLERGLFEQTGSGGWHVLYKHPGGYVPSRYSKSAIAPGVDFLADGGHQFVTAPSVHANGRPYILYGCGQKMLDEVIKEGALVEPPEWLMTLVIESAPAARGYEDMIEPGEEFGVSTDPQDLDKALDRLSALTGANEGGRNGATYEAARIGRDHGVPEEAWGSLVHAWNERTNTPPLPSREVNGVIRSAYRNTRGRMGVHAVAAQFDDLGELLDDEAERTVNFTTPTATGPSAAGDGKKAAAPADLPSHDGDDEDDDDEFINGNRYPIKHPRRSAVKFLDDCRVIYSGETWYVYQADTWRVVDKDTIYAMVWRSVVATTPQANVKNTHIQEIMKAMMAMTSVEEVAFDTWSDGRLGDYVRVENGIVDLNRLVLLPHSAEWFSLTKLPFRFEPSAKCPRFERFLESIWGDGEIRDQIEALQLWFGYLLSGSTAHQRFAMFLGASRGGKGTLIRLVTAMLGAQNVFGTSAGAFGSSFVLQNLPGRKLAVIADAHAGTQQELSKVAEFILNVTGEDLVMVNRKNRSILSLRLPVKVIVAANHMPKFFDSNGAVTNRMILFRFVKSFQGREDHGLEDALRGELTGIFNWALMGLEKLRQRGALIKPASSVEDLEELAEAMNPIRGFINECIAAVPEKNRVAGNPTTLFVEEAYELYRMWCEHNGCKPYAKGRFSAALKDAFAGDGGVKREKTSWRQGPKRTFFTNLKLAVSVAEFRAQMPSRGGFVSWRGPEDDCENSVRGREEGSESGPVGVDSVAEDDDDEF